ncbi:MAG: hypothetical protein IJX34_02635 [Clostridia bacterium]|nr:hypothetical protein [Clostridia bacterium]
MANQKTEGTKVKKEGVFKRIGKFLRKKSNEAQRATLILFILILLSIITGIVGGYLYQPAKEMYVAESTFHDESREIYDYKIDSDERAEQIAKADEAEKVFASVMDKYTTDSNVLIAKYATIHSTFLKLIIAILVVLPFLAIGIMFIGAPINFLFAIANIIIVTPAKVVIYLFNSLRPEKKPKAKKERPSKHMQIEEAAN